MKYEKSPQSPGMIKCSRCRPVSEGCWVTKAQVLEKEFLLGIWVVSDRLPGVIEEPVMKNA